jgi:hypothetical protein
VLGNENKLSVKIYNYVLNRNDTEFKWTSKIKEILVNVGRPDIWQNLQILVHKNIHKIVKQTLIDQFKQRLYNELQASNKGRIYRSLKTL